MKFRALFSMKEVGIGETTGERYDQIEAPGGGVARSLTTEERADPSKIPAGWKPFQMDNLTSGAFRENTTVPFEFRGEIFHPGSDACWKTTTDGLRRLETVGRLHKAGRTLRYKRFLNDFPAVEVTILWDDVAGAADKVYVVQTSTAVIQRCVLMTTDPGDLVLDPTCGSGTTAYVAEQWGRRWITCDTSRVSLALARTRLMAGRFPYYLLADSEEGRRKEMEVSGKFLTAENAKSAEKNDSENSLRSSAFSAVHPDIKHGFVYRRVPHITLKSIANNEEIDVIHAEFAPKLEKALAALNKAADRVPSRGAGSGDPAYKEGEVPRELPPELCRSRRKEAQTSSQENQRLVTSSPTEAEKAHDEFWQLRRGRQQAIDASIARRADTEQLYDQPYEDPKRIRVTGPLTVESLSPHRVLSADADQDGTVTEAEGRQHHDFASMILDNLKKAGVQNTRKAERLKFETLESYAGQWIHAVGTFEERAPASPSPAGAGEGWGEGRGAKTKSASQPSTIHPPPSLRRAAICIGPEHGTVGPDLVKDAAKEAVQGVGFDLLIVCGFAFDPHVSEEMKRYGKLTVVPARMNPDLAMGDELLKKTGTGNLFMVFGEPDVEIREVKTSPSPLRGERAGVSYAKVEVM